MSGPEFKGINIPNIFTPQRQLQQLEDNFSFVTNPIAIIVITLNICHFNAFKFETVWTGLDRAA